ncbi:hypothetical protein BKA62DRAFT_38740 [Auriculariales sp. MPI-PUGE-AT-0066]|nr:hypothetical protein BKA62DRAFT_38740 [Auriculariales sp. MPI-PUGE-AT-0066]
MKPTVMSRVQEPSVTLDTTYAELYAGGEPANKCPVPLYLMPNSEVDLSQRIRRAKKYIYHDTSINSEATEAELERYRDVARAKYLGFVSQHLAFVAGAMPVYQFFHPGTTEGNIPHTERVLSILAPHQQPRVRYVAGPLDVVMGPDEILAVGMPTDDLEHLPHLIDPETHYELLSKRGLALSGLRTPRATLLDLDMTHERWRFHSRPNALGVSDEVEAIGRMTRKRLVASDIADLPAGHTDLATYIREHPLPFVIKLQQSVSGHGTWLVTTEEQREQVAHDIPRISTHFIAKIEEYGAKLRSCSLIITEYIPDVVIAPVIIMFVQHGGNPVFLGCTDQNIVDGRWSGSSIDYRKQSALAKRLEGTINSIAEFLWSRGYYGPAGADILEDQEGTQWIVDLNVRTSGSVILTLLQGHFYKQRGLPLARLLPSLHPKVDRDALTQLLRNDVEAGTVLIVGWLENDLGRADRFANIVVAAEDHDALDQLTTRVKNACLASARQPDAP